MDRLMIKNKTFKIQLIDNIMLIFQRIAFKELSMYL